MLLYIKYHFITELELTIFLLYSSLLQHQTILTHTIFNNYQLLAYILYYLNNFTKIIQF